MLTIRAGKLFVDKYNLENNSKLSPKEVFRVLCEKVFTKDNKGRLLVHWNNTKFDEKQKKKLGTVRHLVWEKTNPSPMNGQYIYLSGIENAVWFKKKGATFNAHCKNPVFRYACGRSKLHPTEKNHDLLKELILDNSNEGDIVFDPCAGSGSHLLVAKENNRQWLGVELNREYFNIASERVCR